MKEIKIGRSNDNDIVIDDNSVSRNHAIIFVSENATMIQDNNSTNGTFINGRRIQGSSPLQTNDILKVGNMPVPWRNYVGGNPSSNSNQSTRVTPNQNQYNAPVGGNGNQANQQNYPTKEKSSVGMGIVISVVAVVLFAGVFLLMKNNSNSSSDGGGVSSPSGSSQTQVPVDIQPNSQTQVPEVSPEVTQPQDIEVSKTQLIDYERLNPLEHLSKGTGDSGSYSGSVRPTIIGNGAVVDGKITNIAKFCTYKNIQLIFKFYSSTNRLISDEKVYLDKYFPPNSTVPFKIKLACPKGTSSIGWSIVSAEPN